MMTMGLFLFGVAWGVMILLALSFVKGAYEDE